MEKLSADELNKHKEVIKNSNKRKKWTDDQIEFLAHLCNNGIFEHEYIFNTWGKKHFPGKTAQAIYSKIRKLRINGLIDG